MEKLTLHLNIDGLAVPVEVNPSTTILEMTKMAIDSVFGEKNPPSMDDCCVQLGDYALEKNASVADLNLQDGMMLSLSVKF